MAHGVTLSSWGHPKSFMSDKQDDAQLPHFFKRLKETPLDISPLPVLMYIRPRAAGGIISREPGPMKHGPTVLAFVKDLDGYAIELLEDRES